MTECDLKKAQELKEQVEKMKACVKYFSPLTNGRYSGVGRDQHPLSNSARATIQSKKFPFLFELFTKSKTTADCRIQLKGYFGGLPIEVDVNFVQYCRAYFENELAKAERAFADYGKDGGTDNGKR